MKFCAVYTAIVGNYDRICQPTVIDERFDYILFSNDISEKKVGVWQVRPIPYHNKIQTKIARWVKTHPNELLPEYPATLWMDANIQIVSPYTYTHCQKLFENQINIASIIHPERDCIYEEITCCICEGIESEKIAISWMQKLRRKKYPLHNGLHETNVLYRINNNPRIAEFNRRLWSIIDNYSKRDQFSFDYVLWYLQIECESFLPIGSNSRNSNDLKYIVSPTHKSHREVSSTSHPFYYWFTKAHLSRSYWNYGKWLTQFYYQTSFFPLPIISLYIASIQYKFKVYILRRE